MRWGPRVVRSMAALVTAATLLFWSGAPGAARPAAGRVGGAPAPLQRVIVVAEPGQAGAVVQRVVRGGGKVLSAQPDWGLIVAQVPARAIPELRRRTDVRALAADRPVELSPIERGQLLEPTELRRPGLSRSSGPVVLSSDQAQPSAEDLGQSLALTQRETRTDALRRATAADGAGITIAVVDTGIDPGQPDLQKTPNGEAKIVDWQDFSGEGDVQTERSSEVPEGVVSQSGTVFRGAFAEQQIGDGPAGDIDQDLNRNGKRDDVFPLVVSDPETAGTYDTVWIDTNLNGSFADEQPLGPYRDSRQFGRFGRDDPETPEAEFSNFVVTRISPDGTSLNIGFDGALHGTHVAGIAAANGRLVGQAPGAKLMAIKVLATAGGGSWSGILQGIVYAAQNGADVINLSLGGMDPDNGGNDPQSELINRISRELGVAFVIAAGNSGPGLNTLAVPGVAAQAITAGAYVSPETFELDYGLPGVPSEGLWYFSSMGPRDDGGLKPNVVAPGSARSTVPEWAGGSMVLQGTSMASPQTAGAAALLLGLARREGLRATPADLRLALELSARPLDGYLPIEQGGGLIQLDRAWEALRKLAGEQRPEVAISAWGGRALDGSLYARENVLRNPQLLALRNGSRSTVTLEWDAAVGNLPVQIGRLTLLPPAAIRLLVARYALPSQPGLYASVVRGRAAGQSGPAVSLTTTAIVPYDLSRADSQQVRGIAGEVEAARFARQFVRVPAGSKRLVIDLSVPKDADGKMLGRVRALLTQPDGMPYGAGTDYVGAPESPDRLTYAVEDPMPGVWEIDIYASHGGGKFGVPVSQYSLAVAAVGVYARPASVDLGYAYGQRRAGRIEFTNFYSEFTPKAQAMGFGRPQAKELTVEDQNFVDEFFEVGEGVPIMTVALDRVADPQAKVSMALYYNDPQVGWRRVGRASGQGQSWTVVNPSAGQYAAEVIGVSVPSGKTSLRLVRTEAADRGEMSVLRAPDKPVPFGGRFEVAVAATVPVEQGGMLGAIVIRDPATNEVLTVVPVTVR